MTQTLTDFLGTYVGEGVWRDETTETRRYRVDMRLSAAPDGTIEQWFRHLFFEENDDVVEQTLVLATDAAGVVACTMPAAQLAGKGYTSGDIFHYELHLPGNAIEVTQFYAPDGGVRVVGSAERNKFGRYIWWQETLRRVAA